MADDARPEPTRRELPDELPRSAVSSKRLPRLDGGRYATPPLLWLLLGLLVVVAFVAALWILNPPSERIGRASPDIIAPAAPPPRT
jgi:hypothetical protein